MSVAEVNNNDNGAVFFYNQAMKLLIIEDEKGLSDAISHILRSKGWLLSQSFDGKNGLEEALSNLYDIIILDVMLPVIDGFTILKKLRDERISTPVLMLTAKGDLSSRIKGLDTGADYYLAKPFEMDELIACINALTRRKETKIASLLSFGDVSLKEGVGLLVNEKTGENIKLSAREITLIEMLLSYEGRIVNKEQIIEKLWGYESEADYNSVEVYISFLRKKLKYIKSNTEIKAARGIGYYLECKDD